MAQPPKDLAQKVLALPPRPKRPDLPASVLPLQFIKGERVAFLGNSMAERMNLFGHFETLLHFRFPQQELIVRNFARPAEEVGIQQRSADYTALDDPQLAFGADTYICFFGFNESYAGPEGVEQFRQKYMAYIDTMAKRYARDDSGKWRWVMVTKPAAQEVQVEVIKGLAPGSREYAAYLPLYNGVELLEIGVPKGCQFEGLAPRSKPVVFYGTSISHGACASRPGMVHTAILGRRLDMPVVNLGFSGNGRMDSAVGEFLGRIDASAFVIDCLPNMGPVDVTAKCVPLIHQLRAAKPSTPIILVEDRRFTNDWITPAKAKFHDDNHAALKEAWETLRKEGVPNLYYISGDALYGTDSEGATDASHANDLGFMRQADIFEPVLRRALAK
jgi:hypothetical protein